MSLRRMIVAGVALFAAGVVVGGVVVHQAQDGTDDHPEPLPAAYSEVDEPLAGELAERFRPWLKFDDGEHWRPLNVSGLLAERREGAGAHLFCTPPSEDCEPIDGEANFESRTAAESVLGQQSFVDLAGRQVDDYRGTHRCEERLYDCSTGRAAAIYYHATLSNDRYYVDYWWFLRYNNFELTQSSCRERAARKLKLCGEHEGDWEGVTVVTRPGSTTELDYVVFAAHDATFRYSAAELGFHPDTTRPNVYVARGSHASYPRACSGGCDQPITFEGLVYLPEGNSNGNAEWVRNDDNCKANAPASCLLSLPRTDRNRRVWTVWPGRWGAGCQRACRDKGGPDSPRSPGLQTRYQNPRCSTQNGVFTCDGRALGCTDWLGPLVVAVACDPDLVAEGLADPTEQQVGRLTLKVEGEERNRESTPGIVQALGSPLQPGQTVSVTGGGPGVQLLVRAQDGRFVVEARFGKVALEAGKPTVVTATKGPEGPVLLAEGRQPAERRVLEIESGS